MKQETMFANFSVGDCLEVEISVGGYFHGVSKVEILDISNDRLEIFVRGGGRFLWLCEKNLEVHLSCPGREKIGIWGNWEPKAFV